MDKRWIIVYTLLYLNLHHEVMFQTERKLSVQRKASPGARRKFNPHTILEMVRSKKPQICGDDFSLILGWFLCDN